MLVAWKWPRPHRRPNRQIYSKATWSPSSSWRSLQRSAAQKKAAALRPVALSASAARPATAAPDVRRLVVKRATAAANRTFCRAESQNCCPTSDCLSQTRRHPRRPSCRLTAPAPAARAEIPRPSDVVSTAPTYSAETASWRTNSCIASRATALSASRARTSPARTR